MSVLDVCIPTLALMLLWLFHFISGTEFAKLLVDGLLNLGPKLCTAALPTSAYRSLSSALICGSSLPPGQEKQMIIDTGMIHLLVVSGWHLVFIEILLKPVPRGPRLVVLTLYAFLTGFQVPVLRALLRRLLKPWWQRHHGLTALQCEAAGTLLLLFLFPDWIFQRSFLMSWMGGLAMCTPQVLPGPRQVDRSLKAYLFMVPFCWASPLQLLWTTLFAPIVGLILFPTCILGMVVRVLVPLSDALWWMFLAILKLGPQPLPAAIFISSMALCGLPPLVHTLLLIGEVRWRRAVAFS